MGVRPLADLSQPLALPSWAERLAAWRQSGWLRPALTAAGGALAAAAILVVGLAFLRSSSPAPGLTLPRAVAGSAPVEGGAAAPAPGAAPAVPTVTVHVAGQVVGPGVYAVPAGGRVADAIVASGGMSPGADVEQLNLAARVADGDRIYVPRKGETPPPVVSPSPPAAGGPSGTGRTGSPGGPVDLNTATAEQLDALPGVGPATSRAILAYRSSRGRFRSVTELLEVPGIGPAKLEALRPLVKV